MLLALRLKSTRKYLAIRLIPGEGPMTPGIFDTVDHFHEASFFPDNDAVNKALREIGFAFDARKESIEVMRWIVVGIDEILTPEDRLTPEELLTVDLSNPIVP